LGERLFEQAKCSGCHLPELTTGDYPLLPQIEHQTFRAYTDLLLHDMGEDLADGRADFLAGPRDWRTPPLWGIGLSAQVNGSTNFLHDGRARNIQEAILWHGGEAKASRDLFADMSKDERNALIAFVNSL
ncbi:MAG: c-type cytochrome, partial [Betaproteobacteria bacterium]|nr:c-type cytochrome [Betaproteobacteria bacterium]